MTKRAIASALIATAVSMAAPTVPAFAADIAPRVAPMPAAMPAMAPRYSWYGFYVGVHGGYGWGGGGITFNGAAVPLGTPSPVAGDARGALGGVTYGSNFQFDNIVIGTESDFAFSGIKKSETLGPIAGFTTSVIGEAEAGISQHHACAPRLPGGRQSPDLRDRRPRQRPRRKQRAVQC